MQRRFRAFTVVVVAALATWGGWWWVRHAYVSPTARPAAAVIMHVLASPDICVEPDGTVVNNCAQQLAEGKFVLVAPGHTVFLPQQQVTVQQGAADEAGGAPATAADDGGSGPCVTPAGDIYSPNCAAPPNSSAVGGGPSGGGGGSNAEPNPCITPAGAIYSPGCAATPAP